MSRMSRTLYLHAFAILMALLLSFCVLPRSEARDLTDVLIQGFNFHIGSFGGPSTGDIGSKIAPAMASAVASTVTREFPLASVAPAFTYHYNPTLSIFERSTGVPGPIFSERALTLGEGQLNFGVGYAFIDFSHLNGTDLDNFRSPGLINPLLNSPSQRESLIPFSWPFLRNRITIQAHVIVPTLRYGITDRWDVSLSVPIVNTFLRVRNELVRVLDIKPGAGGIFVTKDGQLVFSDSNRNPVDVSTLPLVKSQFLPHSITLAKAAGSATGVGDIVLRTKYHLWGTETGGVALGLNLQLPSGEVRDFHGTDETHLSTFVYLSQVLGERVEPHLNIGVDFNADDMDRSSFLWAVGTTLLVGTKLGLVVDFIGHSDFGRVVVSNPKILGRVLNRAPDTCTAQNPCFLSGTIPVGAFPEEFKRNDIANFTFGLRYALGTAGSIFFGVVVPINDEGMRPDFIPAGGIEYTF